MYNLRRGYEVVFTVMFTDDMLDTASVDGVPVWSISGTSFSVTPAPNGMSATIRGIGTVIGSTGVLTVNADADLGSGVVPVTKTETFTLTSGAATSATFGIGEPRPITQ